MSTPIIPWMGGKRRLADRLIPLFPPHECYVEIFAGGAALYFMRPQAAPVEVLNDINGDLVTLYRVMDFDWLDERVKDAVGKFWTTRDGGLGVLAGKTLDAFVHIIEKTVRDSGLVNAKAYTGKNTSQLPGFFRPHKCWDVVVIDNGKLVAAVEFKSQVGSIGNNFNNRTEEVLGSSLDLRTAIEESAFGDDANIFTGYIIVVEDSAASRTTPNINMSFFPVMTGFLLDEAARNISYAPRDDATYPRAKGISYIDRYDVMCKRLMIKGLYTATALITAPKEIPIGGSYNSVSAQTSIQTFMLKLANHCEVIDSINNQAL